MPRYKKNFKRKIISDPRFDNVDVAKFVNILMLSGKKSIAENIIYKAFDYIKKKLDRDPLEIFSLAINNCQPLVEVKSKRIGGTNFQIPVEVNVERRLTLSMRWLRMAIYKRKEKIIYHRLALELIEASEGRGNAIKKKNDVHKMAEANKAFSHFRF